MQSCPVEILANFRRSLRDVLLVMRREDNKKPAQFHVAKSEHQYELTLLVRIKQHNII
jgi:hypothetical protein